MIRAVTRCSVSFPFLFASKRYKENISYVCYLPAIATARNEFREKNGKKTQQRQHLTREHFIWLYWLWPSTRFGPVSFSVFFIFSFYTFVLILIFLKVVWETYIPIVALASSSSSSSERQQHQHKLIWWVISLLSRILVVSRSLLNLSIQRLWHLQIPYASIKWIQMPVEKWKKTTREK